MYFRHELPESRFKRRKLQYPELNRYQSSRKAIGRTKTGLMNLYSKEFNNQFDLRLQSVQRQEKQHPILNLYSKTKQLKFKPKSSFLSQMHLRSTTKDARNDLGHDLDQLTKGNQHGVKLSPQPSLTIMVQPNKIDYTERSMYAIVDQSFHFMSNHIEFAKFCQGQQ